MVKIMDERNKLAVGLCVCFIFILVLSFTLPICDKKINICVNTLIVCNILALNIFVYTKNMCYHMYFQRENKGIVRAEYTKKYYIANADDLGSVMIGLTCKGEYKGEYDFVLIENVSSI